MRRTTLAVGVAALAALVSAGACSSSSNDRAGQVSEGASTSASATDPHKATDPHNQTDVMFTQQMIAHHKQAIAMSDMALGKQGVDPRVVDLAKQIKAAQGPEIEVMQTWLSLWDMRQCR